MKRFGGKLPDRIKNKPVLKPHLRLYFDAFCDLDSERNHGMGLCKIPWSAIANYARFNGFDSEQTGMLMFFIKNMDTEHLKRLEKKQSNG